MSDVVTAEINEVLSIRRQVIQSRGNFIGVLGPHVSILIQ